MIMARRRYSMSRVEAGDWIVPANDGETLWRVYRYDEDGSGEFQDKGGRWHKILGAYWATAKFKYPLDRWEALNDPLSWEHWDTWETGYYRRADAVESIFKVREETS